METEAYLNRIRIVLVDTQDGANIGSVCRAMKTMGIEDLALVTDRTYDEDRVRTLALHAADVYENAKRYHTLEEALADSIFTVGATRRRGKFRKLSSYSPEQLAEKISNLPEVAACASIVTIPTSDRFPSLNLSQAVQIICYTLFRNALVYEPGMVSIPHEKARESAKEMSDHLENIGYFKMADERKWTEQLLSDIVERAQLTGEELRRFEKIFRKAELIALHKRGEDA